MTRANLACPGGTKQSVRRWQRLEHGGRVIYIQPEKPDWLVPSTYGDHLLQALLNTDNLADAASRLDKTLADAIPKTPGIEQRLLLDLDRLQQSLKINDEKNYGGRGRELTLGRLKECWFHLTDRCNLSCAHCLFGASPAKSLALSRVHLDSGSSKALELGCRLFYFTGGEPFLYPDFFPWLTGFLSHNPQAHAVILTNGTLLQHNIHLLPGLERLHLQVSLDGMEQAHDRLRGQGAYSRLLTNLAALHQAGIPFTLSIAISRANVADLAELVSLAAAIGAASIHLLYLFIRGKASREQFVGPAEIFPHLLAAWQRAEQMGLPIDNIETMRGQVFSTPGTRHDLSNSGWESLAIGPDGVIYPSPALVGLKETACGDLAQGLATVWRSSPVLQSLRNASLIDSSRYAANLLKFIIGGGDIDHSFLTGGEWTGHDPYVELYNKIALELISRQAALSRTQGRATIALRMGDIRHDCPDPEAAGRSVTLTHCNCVISLSSDQGHNQVREFYGQAALAANNDIVNPLAPAQGQADFIPEVSRKRSYGCGSPVTDAAPQAGETLVDLGSGSGVECFMAAAAVGAQGRVFGIDMTTEMLRLATTSKEEVVARLGYDNVVFRHGFLEQIPLDNSCADIVISNCVINLSPDKRRTYQEIFRVLKPGGRMVISDIITDTPVPATIKNNVLYRGECLGGAMQQEELVAMLEATGFAAVRLLKRFPYRQVEGMDFFSLTYQAQRPEQEERTDAKDTGRSCVYRGPYGAVFTESGILLVKGRRTKVPDGDMALLDDSVFILDEAGAVTNLEMTNSCCVPPSATPTSASCCAPPSATLSPSLERAALGRPCPSATLSPSLERAALGRPCPSATSKEMTRQSSGCLCCGGDLHYFTEPQEMACHYCGQTRLADCCCPQQHFVCNHCHQENGLEVIRSICTTTGEKDLIRLLTLIRSHPSIPMHGPDHHAMIPGILLACYRNSGGAISSQEILTAINRGAEVPGGVCGFWGACGAAIGIGIGVATILAATPLTAGPRQLAQEFSGRILIALASRKSGRCCQRETYIALTETARLSSELLPISLRAEAGLHCAQYRRNKECIRAQCPLWEQRVRFTSTTAIPMAIPLF
ncbi:MAG: methyltransferase domain-containing protein [Desulfoarculaceae bacterium]|nr:methyltransferase domain-containing protein [Desulfoarculaceae bacterium]